MHIQWIASCRRGSAGMELVRAISLALLGTVLLSACTTTRVVSAPQTTAIEQKVRPGDTVTCHLNDGRTVELEVTAVEATAITGKTGRVLLADVKWLEVKRLSVAKSVGVVGVVALTVLIVVGLSHFTLFPGPLQLGPM